MTHIIPTPEALLRRYIRAKDENRPHLMARTFAPDARLQMHLQTETIAFPAESIGVDAIADTLVRDFGRQYDNVYTFYVTGRRPLAHTETFACPWLVGMTEKATGSVRVGCGRYEWTIDAQRACVTALTITITHMSVLPATCAESMFAWLTSLGYPWTPPQAIFAHAPADEAFGPVLNALRAACEPVGAIPA